MRSAAIPLLTGSSIVPRRGRFASRIEAPAELDSQRIVVAQRLTVWL